MKLIKNTISVCPVCLKHLDAQVTQEGNGICLSRTCSDHGPFSNIVEKDVKFYKAAANINRKRYIKWGCLIIPVTDRCNLHCKFCFYPNENTKDMSFQEIIDLARSCDLQIALSGGEATLRPDLFEIIKELRKMGKSVVLMTNGIKLADLEFVKGLKNAGLPEVLFSLNGFSNDILKEIDNRADLGQKLKAIDNLKSQGIIIHFSLSLLR